MNHAREGINPGFETRVPMAPQRGQIQCYAVTALPNIYRSEKKLGEGNVFTGICLFTRGHLEGHFYKLVNSIGSGYYLDLNYMVFLQCYPAFKEIK